MKTGTRLLRRLRLHQLSCIGCLLLAAPCWARTISVGPQGEVQHIAQAAERALDGDVVEIASGVYRGDVAVWRQRRLTLRGVGPTRPVLIADGRHAEAKGIWVLKDGTFEVSHLEFRGARVPDGNGAGIRFERGSLRVDDCVFEDNQHGILTNNEAEATLRIDSSRFAFAPEQADPPPHLLYVGRIASLQLQGSSFSGGHVGHLVKSRARHSELHYNRVVDGPAGRASYELEFPNGGRVTLVGNTVEQGPRTGNAALVAYGAEGRFWPDNRLDMAHNTVVNARLWPAWFVRVWSSAFPSPFVLNAYNNLVIGPGLSSPGLGGEGHGNRHLWQPPWAVTTGAADTRFKLAADSPLRPVPAAPDPAWRPVAEFREPAGLRPLQPPARWAPGAFQSSATPSR